MPLIREEDFHRAEELLRLDVIPFMEEIRKGESRIVYLYTTMLLFKSGVLELAKLPDLSPKDKSRFMALIHVFLRDIDMATEKELFYD